MFSDSTCTVLWSHPSIIIGPLGTTLVDGLYFNGIAIRLDVGFPSVNLYIKRTTNGLVSACSQPIEIEVCGHETVSLTGSPINA